MRFHLVAVLVVTIGLFGCGKKEEQKEQGKDSQGGSAAPAAAVKDAAPKALKATAKTAKDAAPAAEPAAKSVVAPSGGGKVAQNFDKVKPGMSQDEILKILGQPQYQGAHATDDGAITNFMYQEAGKSYSIVFKDGKVTNTGFGGNADDKSAVSAEKVTANFSKVKLGMSQQEVDSLLGQPSGSSGGAGSDGKSFVVYTYEVSEKTYTIMFADGKVQNIAAGG